MMRKAAVHAATSALTHLFAPGMRRFRQALAAPAGAQQTLLQELVARLARTEYGRSLGISSTDDASVFRSKVPAVTYDTLAPWVERQRQEEGKVLVDEPVLFYEKTSGSSGASKYIPYTASLRRSFTRMFLLWANDVLAYGPRFIRGTLYFSVTPGFALETRTCRGVPIGTSDDGEYLEGPVRALLAPFWVNPSGLKTLRSPEAFKDVLGAALLAAPTLELVSVWNPSFFSLLLQHLESRMDILAPALRQGALEREGRIFRFTAPAPKRLEAARRGAFGEVWPELKLLSCWTQASSAGAAQALAARFPHAQMQGKGLLATEAPLTFPSFEAQGELPLLSDVYYELEDAEGRLHGLHEVEVGQTYEVLLSQRGGLVRYRLGDRVEVTGRFLETPMLRFVGRVAEVVDLVGEKLHASFVETCLAGVTLPAGFRFLVPQLSSERVPHYVLVLERSVQEPLSVALAADQALQAGHHYRMARLLGQLGPLELRVAPRALEVLHELRVAGGMRRGDIKDSVLLTRVDLAQTLLRALASG